MPYTKTPTMDTYSSDRVQLFREVAQRDGGQLGKDEDYLNVFMEPVKQSKAGDQRHFIMKRCGSSQVISSVAASNVRGMHYWADQGKLYYCVGRSVYVYDVSAGTSVTLTDVFVTSSGEVGFTEFLYIDGTTKIVATDGTAVSGIITIDSSNTVVTSADADLPAHLPYPIFLDGYLFICKTNSADLYNSDQDDPLSWVVGTFISAEMEPDLVVRVAKLNNYIIVFGRESIEYFWDAANAAPDSPLQRNDTPVKVNSYLGGFSIYGNSVYFIGQDMNGQPDVFVLKDFKIESIGTPSISRYLNVAGDDISSWQGAIVSVQGHTFYLINAGSSKTWAIDVDTSLITRWAFQNNSTFDIRKTSSVTSSSRSRSFFALDDGTSTIYRFNEELYQDNGVNYTVVVTTEASDFGTLNRKSMARASLLSDRPEVDSYITLSWSDNDYKTFSTGVSINLNQDLPCATRLGNFRQRIFKITYTDSYPLRIQDLEVDINKGTR